MKLLPVHYEGWEIRLMRIGFAILLWLRLPAGIAFKTQPSPNGLAHWLDLTFLSDPAIFSPLRWIFLGMLGLYVSGRGMFLALAFLLFLNIGFNTLANSQGWIGHTDQIISLVLLVQTVFYGVVAVRKRIGKPWQSPGDLEVFFTLQTIAATYVVAGLFKLLKTQGTWIAQLPNITVQIVKTNDQFFYDRLAHPHPGIAEWIHQLIVAHPGLAYPLFAPGLLVELAAFFLLFGRRPALFMGVLLLILHALIHLVMQITFTTNIALLVIYAVNLPFWTVAGVRWWRARAQRMS